MEPQQRQHLGDDLKGILKGEVLFDELSRALYSTDASIFQVQPLGVVVPRDEEDVQTLVRFAGDRQVGLVPRGAGSGVAGEALGSGIIVDMSRHFRGVLEIGMDTVRVQPGVVHRDLNEQLARVGRQFAPDPASGAQCTIGGMLANNASGARALKYGYTRDHVAALRVVWDTGQADWVSQEPRLEGPRSRKQEIVQGLTETLERHADLLDSCQPRTPFNRCGYLVQDVLGSDRLNLPRLLVGSEGTLVLFTEAILRTVPLPRGRAVVLLGLASLDLALQATHIALQSDPAACEMIDRRLLTLARGNDPDISALIPPGVETVLLIEFESETPAGARQAAADLSLRLQRVPAPPVVQVAASEPAEIARLWRIRDLALPSLYGLKGDAQPIAFVEDVGVPPAELGNYLRRVQEILQQHETTASFLVHAATGQVHTRPFLDLRKPEDAAKLWALAEDVHALALELGGTVSTQHGTGLARTPWVARQYGRLYPVFREIKTLFDPRRIFNPGKIIGPDPGMPAWPLRARRNAELPAPEAAPSVSNGDASKPAEPSAQQPAAPLSALHWEAGELRREVFNCNGCGQCRTQAPGQRMCPIFRATHAEAATPRAKANLLRYLLEEASDSRLLTSDDVREVADLCVNCKMCAQECPAHVNIPKLMLEAKAAHAAEHGLDRSDWILSRTEAFAAIGSAFAFLANLGLGSSTVRWLLEKMVGLSRRRRLPRFAGQSFLRRAARHGWTRRPSPTQPRVAYFIDIFANYNDPSIAEAVVAVLAHNGIPVFVPPDQRGCGMAPLAYGDVEAARETAQRNLRILADLAREDFTILCSEPTAALMLRHDYLDLLDDPDARLVADHTVELTAYLWSLYQQGKLRTDFQPLACSVGHHVPCHLKALNQPPAGPALLGLIPRLRVHTIDVSCSGMAGTFGLKAENYRVSLEAGRPMLRELRRSSILFGSTECSTCRMQMEEGARKRTLHPVQYLALAYGLLPELKRRLLTKV